MARPSKVISGGQTGVDQAALFAAKDTGIAIDGWCPPNRACELGEVPARGNRHTAATAARLGVQL